MYWVEWPSFTTVLIQRDRKRRYRRNLSLRSLRRLLVTMTFPQLKARSIKYSLYCFCIKFLLFVVKLLIKFDRVWGGLTRYLLFSTFSYRTMDSYFALLLSFSHTTHSLACFNTIYVYMYYIFSLIGAYHTREFFSKEKTSRKSAEWVRF